MNRFWGRNDDTSGPKLSRDENQLLALNYENLCDVDYLNRLFLPPSADLAAEGNASSQQDVLVQAPTRDHESWILSGDTAEDIIVFGGDSALGSAFLEKRFMRDIASVLKVQDTLSSLVYRQVIVFDHIGKLIVAKCTAPDGAECLKSLSAQKALGDSLAAGTTSSAASKKHLAPEILACALSSLERQSRTNLRRSAVEPIISLLVNMFQDHAKQQSKGKVVQGVSSPKNGALVVLGPTHAHLLREILCNGISRGMEFLSSGGLAGLSMGRGASFRDQEEAMKLCHCCAYGLIALGVYTVSPSDIFMAIFHLTALSVLSEELQEELVSYNADAVADEQLHKSVEDLSLLPSASPTNPSVPVFPAETSTTASSAQTKIPPKLIKKAEAGVPVKPTVGAFPKSVGGIATVGNNRAEATTIITNPKKLRMKGGPQQSTSAGAHNSSGNMDLDLDLSLNDGPNTDSRSLLLMPSDETFPLSQSLLGKEDAPTKGTSKWDKPNQKAALPVPSDKDSSNGKSKVHLSKGKSGAAAAAAALADLIDEASTGVISVNYLSNAHDHNHHNHKGLGSSTTGAKHHQGTALVGKGGELQLPNGKVIARAKNNNNQLKVGKMPASSSSSVVVADGTSKDSSSLSSLKTTNNMNAVMKQPPPSVPVIPLHEAISPIPSNKKQKLLSERALAQIFQAMHRVPKTVLRILQDGSAVLQTANGQGVQSAAVCAYKSLIASKSYVWSCGQNSYGELGHGDTNQRKVFTKVSCLEGKGIVSVGAGNEHSVFVTKEGKVLVTGYNDNGQCGVGNNQQVKQPSPIQTLEGEEITNVYVYNGCEHTLAVTKDGKLYSFGYNYRGQLGHGTTTSENVPRLVKGLMSRKVLLAACSYHHSIMLCSDGAIFTCGRNDCGQLGLGDTADKKVPQLVSTAPKDIIGLSCGQYHTVLLTESGVAYVCGKNDYGQLGMEGVDNLKVLTKAVVTPESDSIKSVCCGYYHTMFLSHNGIVSGFGRNDYGQLGLGHMQARVYRCQVITSLRDKNVVSVSAGCYHSVAVTCNGMLYVFGRNNHGQLGTGDLEERDLPHPVDDFVGSKIISVAAGFYHTLVLAVDASVDVAADILEDSEAQVQTEGDNKAYVTTDNKPPYVIVDKPKAGTKLASNNIALAPSVPDTMKDHNMKGKSASGASSNPITSSRRGSNSYLSTLSATLFAGLGPSPLLAHGSSGSTLSLSARKSLDVLQDAAAAAANFGMERNVSSAHNFIVKGFSMENRSKSATIRELLAYLVLQLEAQITDSSSSSSAATAAATTSQGESVGAPSKATTTDNKSSAASSSSSPVLANQVSWLIRQLRAISMMLELMRYFCSDSDNRTTDNDDGDGSSKSSTQLPFTQEDATPLTRTLIRTAAHFLQTNRSILIDYLTDADALVIESSSSSSTEGDGRVNRDDDQKQSSAAIDISFTPPKHRTLRAIDIIRDVHAAAAAISAAASPADDRAHHNKNSSTGAGSGAPSSGRRAGGGESKSIRRTDSFEDTARGSATTRSCGSSIQSVSHLEGEIGGCGGGRRVAPGMTTRRTEGGCDTSADSARVHVTKAVERLRQELLYSYFNNSLHQAQSSSDQQQQQQSREKDTHQQQQQRQSVVIEAASAISKSYDLLFPSLSTRAKLFGMLSKIILSYSPDAQSHQSEASTRTGTTTTTADRDQLLLNYQLALRLLTRVSFKYRSSHEVIKLFRSQRHQGLVIFQNMLSVYNHLSLYSLDCHARKTALTNNGDINRALATLEHCNASFIKCAIPLIFAEQNTQSHKDQGALPELVPGTGSAALKSQWFEFGITIVKEVFHAAESVLDLIARYSLTEDVMHVLRYGTVIPSVLPSILMYGISNSRSNGCVQELLPLVRSLTRKLQNLGSECNKQQRPNGTNSSSSSVGGAADSGAAAAAAIVPSKRVSGVVTKNGAGSGSVGVNLTVLHSRGFGRGDEDLSDAAIVPQAATSDTNGSVVPVGASAAAAMSSKKDKEPMQVSWWSRLLKLSTILSAKLAAALIHEGHSSSSNESGDDLILSAGGLSSDHHTSSISSLPIWNYISFPSSPDVLRELSKLPMSSATNSFIVMATSAEVTNICSALRAREATVDATYRMLQQASKASKMNNVVHSIENVLFAAFLSVSRSNTSSLATMKVNNNKSDRRKSVSILSSPLLIPPEMNTFYTSTWTAIAKLTKTIQSRRSQLLNPSESGLSWSAVLDLLYRIVLAAAQFTVSCPSIEDIGVALPLPRKGAKFAAFRRACMVIICLNRWSACRRLRVKSQGVFLVDFVTSVVEITTKSLSSVDTAEDVEKRWQLTLAHFTRSSAKVARFAEGVSVITDTLNEAVYNSMKCDVLAVLMLAWRECLTDEHLPLCCTADAGSKKSVAISSLIKHVCGIVQDFSVSFQGSYATATAGDFTLFSLALKFIQLLCLRSGGSHIYASVPQKNAMEILLQLRSIIMSLDEKVFEGSTQSAEEKSLLLASRATVNGKTAPRDRSKAVRRAANSIIALIQQLSIRECSSDGVGSTSGLHQQQQQGHYVSSSSVGSPAFRSVLVEFHCELFHYFQRARIVSAKTSQDMEANASGKGDGSKGDGKNSKDNSKRRCQDIIVKPMEFCRSQEGFVIQGDKLLNNYKGIDFTLAVWVFFTKKTTSRHSFITGKLSHHDAWPLIALRSDGKLDVIYGHSSEFERMTSAANIPLTTWTHLAVVVEPKKIKLFINGVLDAQTGTKGNSRAVLFPVVVGSCPQGVRTHVDQARVGFDGLLASYKYYTRALSPIHVKVVFDQGPPESHDRRERWEFQLLTSFRILLENGGIETLSDQSVRAAAETLQMLFVTDTAGRLRCGALRLLDEVLQSDRITDMRVFENRGITATTSSTSASAAASGNEVGVATNLITSVPISECLFLSEMSSFKERLILYFVRVVGACWAPGLIVSADDSSSALLTELAQRPKGAAAVDLERDARLTELLLFAPIVLGEKSSRPSSPSFSPSIAGSAAALDRLAAREDATGELSFHIISTLRNLASVDSWRSALSNALSPILDNYKRVLDSNSHAEWTPMLIIDILGASAVLGENSCGPYLGAAVESYFSDRSCRVLNIFKATNNAILLSWNAEASKRQLSTVRLTDLTSCKVAPFAFLTPQLVLSTIGVLDSLKRYAQLTVSDLLAVYRPDHAFSRFTLLRSLRPAESLIFHQLLRCISLITDESLTKVCAAAFDNCKPLYNTLLQACARAMWLQSSEDDAATDVQIPSMWNRSAPFIVSMPQKTCMADFPPIESDRVFMDFVNKHLGIAVESFQGTPYEKLLKQGLISEVIFSNSTGSAKLGDIANINVSSKDPSSSSLSSSSSRDNGGFLLSADDKFPVTDWTGVTPFGSSFNVRSIIAGAVSGELSELDSAAALRLMFQIRRSIITSARHAMIGPLRLLSAANFTALPLQWKAVLWHGLAPFTCRSSIEIASGSFSDMNDTQQAKPSGIITSSAKVEHPVTVAMFQSLQANHRVEFTVSLASSLRYSAISLKNSSSVLESSDLFTRLLSGAEIWLDMHEDDDSECELCYHLLRMILPSLLFVKSTNLELKMMMLCRRALTRLILRLLSGYEPSKELLDLAKSNNFTLLRARAQEQLSLQKGYIRSDFNPFAHNLTQLVAGLEFLQRHAASNSLTQSRSLLHSSSATSLVTGRLGGNSSVLSTPVKPTHLQGTGRAGSTSVLSPPINSTPLQGAGRAGSTSVLNTPIKAIPLQGASGATSSLAASSGTQPTAAPRMVTLQSTSIEADLHTCAVSAIEVYRDILAASAANSAAGGAMMTSPRSYSTSTLLTATPSAAPMVGSPSSSSTSPASTAAVTVASFTEGLIVEVALGVQIDGEECRYETIYCGNSLRFMQAGLLPGCLYLLKCRASAGGYMLDWSTPLEFRTESGVFFSFDPLKCGPDIQLGEDGLSAAYTGDDSWSTLLGTQSFSSGVVSWEIRVTQSATAYIFIGVATATADLNTFLGGCENGWGFIGEQALYHNRENVKGYGEAFNAGDVIGVILNFHNGTISFSRNGKMLGVAFDKIYGELYPAVAFYNMGQELELIPEGFQTTCPHEPTPCSPARLNLNSISVLNEMLFCVNTSAPFSSRVLALVAEHCTEWAFSKLVRVEVLTGKQMFISVDDQAPLLVKYGLGIGERVRTPFGLAELVGTAHNRLWFRFKDTNQVWFFTHTQIVAGREKGLFMRCSYEAALQLQSVTAAALVDASPTAGASSSVAFSVAGIAGASPATATSLSLLRSPDRLSVPRIPASTAAHGDRIGGGGFDVASLQELLEPARWSGDMDATLVSFLLRLSDAASISPWEVTCDRVFEDFRSLQQQLTRIVLGSVELTHRWGIAGPKRKAVIARIGFLRLLNHQLDVYLPALLLDTSGESLVVEKRAQDEFNPVLTSVKAARVQHAVSSLTASDPALLRDSSAAVAVASEDHILHAEDACNPNAAIMPTPSQVSTSWNPLSTSKLLKIGPLPATRYRIFSDLKMTYFWEIVARSAARPAKTDDDYDYPEDLPQVKINRFKSFRAREAAELMGIPGEDLLLSSMFCQLWRELNSVSPEKLRISYTHPMDDGQSRTFKVRFEGEAADDYGGPYREIFQLICDELLQSDPSAEFRDDAKVGTSSHHQQGGASNSLSPTRRTERSDFFGTTTAAEPSSNSSDGSSSSSGGDKLTKKPTRCFVPLLHPTPNWTASNCTERYRYMFRPDASSPLRLELFKFLGQMVGIAVRSKITLELPLPSYIWKCVVREPLDERDIASFDAPAADFVMKLGNIHKRLTVLREASKRAKESAATTLSPFLHRSGSRTGIPTMSTPSRPTSAMGASPSSASMMNPSTPMSLMLGTPSAAHTGTAIAEDSDLSQETIPALTSEAEALIQDLSWIATRSDGQVVELVSAGATRPVLIHEIGEYLQLYTEARLSEGAAAIQAFTQGLLSIVPESAMILLGWEELEKVICGSRTIDIERLKANTEYDDDVTLNDTHIVHFWEVLAGFSEEEKGAFLRFVWARPTLPPKGVDFPQKMKVQSAVGDDVHMKPDQYLPKAHTCFFSINLPRYSSKELMAEKLLYAITHCTEMDADFRLTDTDVAGWGLVTQPTWSSMAAED